MDNGNDQPAAARLLYSATTGGFYNSAIHAADALPADAVEVSEAEHAALMQAQAEGCQIGADQDGRPVAVAVVVAYTIAHVKAEAARRISASGLPWMVEREVSGGAPIPQAVKDYAADVRAASGLLEAMDPIPSDYTADHHWPDAL